VYKEKDGSMYEGDWVGDLPDGQGTKTYPDGTKYTVLIVVDQTLIIIIISI
jgi:hypothetical protein